MDFQILPRLTDLLQEFTVVVLREKPEDIVDFAADYFAKLKQSKEKTPPKAKEVSFQIDNGARDSDGSDDEPMPGKNFNKPKASTRNLISLQVLFARQPYISL